MSYLVLTGLNHRTAPLDIRQRAAIDARALPDALNRLISASAIQETIILSTCNRVEILSHVSDRVEGLEAMENFLAGVSGIEPAALQSRLYRHYGDLAIQHLFRVASSLDSMILGEPQILGQVKACYGAAVEAQTVGSHLNALLQAAFRTAKRVRTETSIGEYPVSASSAAVELARKIFGDLGKKRILIVGAGKMGETAVRHLADSGVGEILVTNRSLAAAEELAGKFHGQALPFDNLRDNVAQADIIITSTGAADILIGPELAREAQRRRKNAPMVFIDISVPRNVDPAVGSIDGVFCYDVDDLAHVVEANLAERMRAATEAEKIVDQEVRNCSVRLRALQSAPVVTEVQGRIEEICRAEMERCLRRIGPRDAKVAEELEIMTSRIAAKVAHPLISRLRATADPDNASAYANLLLQIFKTRDAK